VRIIDKTTALTNGVLRVDSYEEVTLKTLEHDLEVVIIRLANIEARKAELEARILKLTNFRSKE